MLLVASLLLVVRPGAPSSFLLLAVRTKFNRIVVWVFLLSSTILSLLPGLDLLLLTCLPIPNSILKQGVLVSFSEGTLSLFSSFVKIFESCVVLCFRIRVSSKKSS